MHVLNESTAVEAVASPAVQLCLCGKPAVSKCGKCKLTAYCSRECQRQDWPTHKALCGLTDPAATMSDHLKAVEATRWLKDFSPPDCYEWLTNCYTMRCNDDMFWGGGYLHGPYRVHPAPTKVSIAADFLCFCTLAKRNGVVPADWAWAAFLKVAARFAGYAFEKSDAQTRWGSENVYNAMMGGRSLRFTAMQVYGSEPNQPGNSRQHNDVLALVAEVLYVSDLPSALTEEVGGRAAWEEFATTVKSRR